MVDGFILQVIVVASSVISSLVLSSLKLRVTHVRTFISHLSVPLYLFSNPLQFLFVVADSETTCRSLYALPQSRSQPLCSGKIRVFPAFHFHLISFWSKIEAGISDWASIWACLGNRRHGGERTEFLHQIRRVGWRGRCAWRLHEAEASSDLGTKTSRHYGGQKAGLRWTQGSCFIRPQLLHPLACFLSFFRIW